MNNFCFTGNIGRDAEVRHTQGGLAIASFPVAVSSGYGDNKSTTWVRCSLFGKRAEGGLIQYLTKGAQVAVSGELRENEYQNQQGETKKNIEVRVNDVTLVGGNQGQQKPQQPASAPTQPSYNATAGDGFEDTEIPF